MTTKYVLNSIWKYIVKNPTRAILAAIFLSTFLLIISLSTGHKSEKRVIHKNLSNKIIRMIERVTIPSNSAMAAVTNSRCSFYNCFNPYVCGKDGQQRVLVYVYPLKRYVTEEGAPIFRHLTKEFYSIIRAVMQSKYYTSKPEDACIFLPSFDTLSQNNFLARETSQALNSLP